MIALFSLEGIQKKAAVFDTAKLEWMNGQYLSAVPAEELVPAGAARARADGRRLSAAAISAPLIDAVKARSRTILHIAEQVAVRLDPSRATIDAKGEALIRKMGPAFSTNLERAADALEQLGPGAWSAERILECLKGVAEAYGLKLGDAMQPVRVALTGSTVSEPVNELLAVVDRADRPSPARVRWLAASARAATRRPRRHDSPGRPRAGPGRAVGLRGKPAADGHSRPAPDTLAAHPGIPAPIPAAPPAPPPKPSSIELSMVGDINLGTATLPDGVPPDSGRGLLDAARPALTGDLVVGNFEGVLADTGTSDKCERMRRRRAAGPGRPTDTAPATRGHSRLSAPGATRSERRRCWRRAWWTRDSRT